MLRDITTLAKIPVKDKPPSLSYTKTNKLITALYMVTDIMDREEPLRNHLRTLGVKILSDTNSISNSQSFDMSVSIGLEGKITEILSLLDLGKTLNLISSMNYHILSKEFWALMQSIKDFSKVYNHFSGRTDIKRLFEEEPDSTPKSAIFRARIGVQKGSTLMRALSKVEMSDRTKVLSDTKIMMSDRRSEILKIIKETGGIATITDIKNHVMGSLSAFGEKTIQRELVSLVKDNVLKKTGEKRWSKYSLLASS